jgi:transcription initiation factor IIE alpha subunit
MTVVDAIKVIKKADLHAKKEEVKVFLLTKEANNLMKKLLDCTILNKEVDEKELFLSITNKSRDDVNGKWDSAKGGYRNSEKMKKIRRIMYLFSECGLTRQKNVVSGSGWYNFTWRFTPKNWRGRFEQSKRLIVDEIAEKIEKIKDETIFECKEKCSNGRYLYTFIALYENSGKCPNGHILLEADKTLHLEKIYADFNFFNSLIFPDEYISLVLNEKSVEDIKDETFVDETFIEEGVIEQKVVEVVEEQYLTQSEPVQSIPFYNYDFWWKRLQIVKHFKKRETPKMAKKKIKKVDIDEKTSVLITEIIINNWWEIINSKYKQKKELNSVINECKMSKKHIYAFIHPKLEENGIHIDDETFNTFIDTVTHPEVKEMTVFPSDALFVKKYGRPKIGPYGTRVIIDKYLAETGKNAEEFFKFYYPISTKDKKKKPKLNMNYAETEVFEKLRRERAAILGNGAIISSDTHPRGADVNNSQTIIKKSIKKITKGKESTKLVERTDEISNVISETQTVQIQSVHGEAKDLNIDQMADICRKVVKRMSSNKSMLLFTAREFLENAKEVYPNFAETFVLSMLEFTPLPEIMGITNRHVQYSIDNCEEDNIELSDKAIAKVRTRQNSKVLKNQ